VPPSPTPVEEAIPGFAPENERERAITQNARLLEGLAWGKPRKGHPEGSVGAHVAALLRTIDEWGETGQRRSDLRFIAIVHDAPKGEVKEWLPRTGENHHAMRARRLAEDYVDDERVLATIELHDRPYSIWKRMRRKDRLDETRFQRMLDRLPDPALFLRFVELDGSMEGKDPEPIRWFREELRRRGVIR
jgi:hypothetical protein